MSPTFNVSDLSPFLVDDKSDLRTNPFQEERNDTSHALPSDKIQGLVREVQSQEVVPKDIEGLEHDELKLVHLIQVKEEADGSISSSFGFNSAKSL